ncbi:hypothetical protein CSPAE12_05344 [Colletotrichum incanum]|nr:hypothetical protein CSPAE12_05344 [Colletotrichum incanum]
MQSRLHPVLVLPLQRYHPLFILYKTSLALKSYRACLTRSFMVFSPSRTQTLGSYFFLLGLSSPSGLPTWVFR